MLPKRTAAMTRRVTVAVCILVFVFGRHKFIRQLCTGVMCRYQVQVFIHKKRRKNVTFTFKPRLPVLAPPLSCKCISFTYHSHILYCFFLPSIPVELSAGVNDLIIYFAAHKQPDTHESSWILRAMFRVFLNRVALRFDAHNFQYDQNLISAASSLQFFYFTIKCLYSCA